MHFTPRLTIWFRLAHNGQRFAKNSITICLLKGVTEQQLISLQGKCDHNAKTSPEDNNLLAPLRFVPWDCEYEINKNLSDPSIVLHPESSSFDSVDSPHLKGGVNRKMTHELFFPWLMIRTPCPRPLLAAFQENKSANSDKGMCKSCNKSHAHCKLCILYRLIVY